MLYSESLGGGYGGRRINIKSKLFGLNWPLLFFICLVALIGFASQYSVANGSFEPYASRQIVRFGIGLIVLVFVAVIDLRFWMMVAYPAYALAFLLLVILAAVGNPTMGAQRWLDFGLFALQPSEVMKIALVLALARYFHSMPQEKVSSFFFLPIPLAMIGAPAVLVLMQPDLGTAVLLIAGGCTLFFLAGLKWRYILGALAIVVASIPIAWNTLLHDYQKERVLTFLNPERDPLGAGWHILQSKTALGAGGITGRGFLKGTQSHLEFLPEKQTDFIFTVWAEEFGLLGAGGLLLLYLFILGISVFIAIQCRNHFGRLVAMGVTTTFFLYIFINVSMVMGLIPVVGVPLPFVSYGGTSMMALMFGFGLIMSVHIHRNMELPRLPNSWL